MSEDNGTRPPQAPPILALEPPTKRFRVTVQEIGAGEEIFDVEIGHWESGNWFIPRHVLCRLPASATAAFFCLRSALGILNEITGGRLSVSLIAPAQPGQDKPM